MYTVIIPMAGIGSRMKLDKNKMLLKINNKYLFEYSVDLFENDNKCNEIIIVLSKEDEKIIKSNISSSKVKYVYGGSERQYSVYNALEEVTNDITLVHDGARINLKQKEVDNLIKEIETSKCVILGVPVKDTIKEVDNNNVQKTLEREKLFQIQTPQAIKTDILKKAHYHAKEKGILMTDESGLIELINEKVKVILGDYDNFKITTPNDIKLYNFIIGEKND